MSEDRVASVARHGGGEGGFPARRRRIAGGLFVTVVLIAVAIRADVLAGFDRAILFAAAPSAGLTPVVHAVTWFGDSLTRVVIAAVVALGLLAVRAWRRAVLFVSIVAGGAMANTVIKAIVHRPRPALLPHLDIVTSFSFPSGHAANSAILYLSIALLAPARHRRAALILAALLVLAIGLSRVALAVHWPSDVLAGWLFGLGWVLLWNQSRACPAAG